jgi:hypothetical protein
MPAEYLPLPPANYQLTFWRATMLSAAALARLVDMLGDMVPAGVGCCVVEGVTSAFRFDIGPGFDLGHLARLDMHP